MKYILKTGTALSPHRPSTVFADMWVEESDGEGKDCTSHSSEAGTLPHSNSYPKPLAVSWINACTCTRTHTH